MPTLQLLFRRRFKSNAVSVMFEWLQLSIRSMSAHRHKCYRLGTFGGLVLIIVRHLGRDATGSDSIEQAKWWKDLSCK